MPCWRVGGISLVLAVALDTEQLEVHFTQNAAGILEGQRKVAVDAVPDVAPFRLHAQGFGDGQLAVFGEADFGIESLDDLGRKCAAAAKKPEAEHDARQS